MSTLNPISGYLAELQRNLAAGNATEHTHRPALQALIQALNPTVRAINEPSRVECGAPDFVVTRSLGSVSIGYVETKDIGKSLDEAERSEQLRRYRRSLRNLVLTNYLEFRLYVDGEPDSSAVLARLGAGNKLIRDKRGEQAVAALLTDFLSRPVEPVATPKELAERMARLTHMIRDIIVESFARDKASPLLRGLRAALAKALIPDLEEPENVGEFADLYAQTIAYGLFMAWAVDVTPGFTVQEAQGLISNPFLRNLFYEMTPPWRDEPYARFLDDLVQLLDSADRDSVLADFGKLTRQQDPVLHFYETFLAAYDPQLRQARGVYYTPEPLVDYIVRSVDQILKTRFGCAWGLADTEKEVHVLDPAAGTGTFLYFVVRRIWETLQQLGQSPPWCDYVEKHLLPRIFGFELLMAPYIVAHMKMDVLLRTTGYSLTGDQRLRIYLTNTLEEPEREVESLFGPWRTISDEGRAAAEVKRDEPIMVVLGNPPYSGHSANSSWEINEKGKRVPNFIGNLVRDYYFVDGKPLGERNPKWLQDDYVKFIRWGQWRIERTGEGVLAFVTNHGYLDNPTFRGMRQQLMQAFPDIYVLDLHGNVKKKEVAPDGSKDENVFDIQQGVAIGIFVKERGKTGPARVHHADLWGLRETKYKQLSEMDLATMQWEDLSPRSPFYLFVPQDTSALAEYQTWYQLTEAIPVNSVNLRTHRDALVIDFDKAALESRIKILRDRNTSDEEVRGRFGLHDTRDWSLGQAREELLNDAQWKTRIRLCLYRPYDLRWLFYGASLVEYPCLPVVGQFRFPNVGFTTTRQTTTLGFEHVLAMNQVVELKCVSHDRGSYCFPLYIYPAPEDNAGQRHLFETSPWLAGREGRVPNLSPQLVADLEARLGLRFVSDGKGDLSTTFGPEDIFHYIYAILHSPAYRERYAEFLKMDFPRVPFTSDRSLFKTLAEKGEELVALHLMESPRLSQIITTFPVADSSEVAKVRYAEPHKDETGHEIPGRVYINKTQYFEGIPPDVWEFQVGGYQVLDKWLKDRKGRKLSFDDLLHYQKVVVALRETIRLMEEIDDAIPQWPLD